MSFDEELRLAFGGTTPPALDSETHAKLEALDRILSRWSPKLDLIGFKTRPERILRYFAEPLAASRWLPVSGSALDIGSGGGSPGLPFAIVRPGLAWTFLEPRLRRRLFLEEAVRELGLENVRVDAERFEKTVAGNRSAIAMRGVRLDRSRPRFRQARVIPRRPLSVVEWGGSTRRGKGVALGPGVFRRRPDAPPSELGRAPPRSWGGSSERVFHVKQRGPCYARAPRISWTEEGGANSTR